MSDIPLFRLADGRTTDLSGRAATIEKHLQWMIEAQMPTFLGVRFLASAGCALLRVAGEVSIFTCVRARLATIGLIDAPWFAEVCTCRRIGPERSNSPNAVRLSVISALSCAKSPTGNQVKSMSTDSRGRSRSNKLIAGACRGPQFGGALADGLGACV